MTCLCQEHSGARRLSSLCEGERHSERGVEKQLRCWLLTIKTFPSTNRVAIDACQTQWITVAPVALLSSSLWKVADRCFFGIVNRVFGSATCSDNSRWDRFSYFYEILSGTQYMHKLHVPCFTCLSPLSLLCALLAPPATTMPQIWTNTGSCSTQAPWDPSTWSSPTSSIGRGCRHSCLWMTQCRRYYIYCNF